MNKYHITQSDYSEIARLKSQGFTSGILDTEDEDGKPVRIVWKDDKSTAFYR